MDRPFSHDRFPKLSDTIRSVTESHPHSKLTGLGVSELRKLECKYATKAARGDANAERELEDIRGILKGKRIKESNGSLGALKAANAADLKEYPGKRGEAAHKRLHKTIGAFLKGKGVKESLDAVNARHGGALERMGKPALEKPSRDQQKSRVDEKFLNSPHMKILRTVGSAVTDAAKQRINDAVRKKTGLDLGLDRARKERMRKMRELLKRKIATKRP